MSIERINPPELARPSGFSHAVAGRGTVVALAGQTALDPTGGSPARAWWPSSRWRWATC